MKKIKRVTSLIIIAVVMIVFLTKNTYAAGINNSVSEKQSNRSHVTFSAKKGEILKISYTSTIEEGSLTLELCKDKKVVEKISTNKKGNLEVKVEDDEEYSLSANYNEFIGQYNVRVFK